MVPTMAGWPSTNSQGPLSLVTGVVTNSQSLTSWSTSNPWIIYVYESMCTSTYILVWCKYIYYILWCRYLCSNQIWHDGMCAYIFIYIYILHYSNMTEALVSGTSSLRRFSAWIRDAHRQGFQGHRGGEFLYAAGGLLEAEFLVLMCWVGGIYRYVYLLRIYIYMFIMYVYVYSFRFVFVWYIQFILNIYIFLFIYFWIYIYIFIHTQGS